MRQKKFVRVVAVILALILLISLIASAVSYMALGATSQSDIDELKSEAELLEKRKTEAESTVNSLEFEQKSILEKKAILDEQVLLVTAEIKNLNEQVATYDSLILEKQEAVEEAKARQNEQLDNYKVRVRTMEENGVLSYFTVLFHAKSFSDFLARLDFITEVWRYDEQLFMNYSKAKIEVEHAEQDLEEVRQEQEDTRAGLDGKQEELNGKVRVADKFLNGIETNAETYEQLCEEIDGERGTLEKAIKTKRAELERTRQQSILEGTGTFIWPTPGNYSVAATFGTQLNNTFRYYRMHYGIDIQAAYGSDVVAADQGTVTAAEYHRSYGNYVIVDHGNEFATIYAHLGSMAVEVGQEVMQGDLIGGVGSTGESTGAHLHFEIRQNGECLNPLTLLTGYSRG